MPRAAPAAVWQTVQLDRMSSWLLVAHDGLAGESEYPVQPAVSATTIAAARTTARLSAITVL